MGKKDEKMRRVGVKAVLFDMDGVLFDSMKNHTLAWYRTISGMGILFLSGLMGGKLQRRR